MSAMQKAREVVVVVGGNEVRQQSLDGLVIERKVGHSIGRSDGLNTGPASYIFSPISSSPTP